MVSGDLVFGFLPQQVLSDFDDVGNWKVGGETVEMRQRSTV